MMPYFEWKAAKFYYDDVKIHQAIDQADSGFCFTNTPVVPTFHVLWKALTERGKNFYRILARRDLYGEKEITLK